MTELAFGDCRIIEEIGSGSISTVYKASQEPLGRLVAVKALKSTIATSSPFAVHLEREAKLLGELCHPNIAQLFQFEKTETQLYLVIEYVDGHSLSKLLAKKRKLRPEVAAAIGADIARGLAHAHDRGVVHRDVKPPNVLLSKRGDVKLVDFGIAQRERMPSLDEPLERADESAAFGTPAYMSPEQILGEYVDARSDMFSLGVVLYQMLAGARPFDSEDPNDRRATAQRIRRDPPRQLRVREPEVPRALERVVMRLLEKLPADRYASASTVADQLDDFVLATSNTPSRLLVTRALIEAGLAKPVAVSAPSFDAGPPPQGKGTGTAIAGFAVLFALLVAGGGVIQWTGQERRGHDGGSGAAARLGYLRVAATPWAEVFVDGIRIDVTPFAHSIPLVAGTHYVTLTHPRAPAEKRTIAVTEGETLVLDVAMKLPNDDAPILDRPASSAHAMEAPSLRGTTARGDTPQRATEVAR